MDISPERQQMIRNYVLLGEVLAPSGIFEGLERQKDMNDMSYAIQVLDVLEESLMKAKEIMLPPWGRGDVTVPGESAGEFMARQAIALADDLRVQVNKLQGELHRIQSGGIPDLKTRIAMLEQSLVGKK